MINSGDNLGGGTPVIKFEQWEKDYIDARLILKGGGCENKNIQYSLPCELEGLGRAGRDLDGIRKCILHSVYQAQGQGCSCRIYWSRNWWRPFERLRFSKRTTFPFCQKM